MADGGRWGDGAAPMVGEREPPRRRVGSALVLALTMGVTLLLCGPIALLGALAGPDSREDGPSERSGATAAAPLAAPAAAPAGAGPAPGAPPQPPAPTPATAAVAGAAATELLGRLTVAPEGATHPYDREAFRYPGGGTDSRGCNTRARVFQRDSLDPPQVAYPGCRVVAGRWVDPYDGRTYTSPSDVSIDHVVALAEAWRSGASSWPSERLVAFGNDVELVASLAVVGGSGNGRKGDKDPAGWLPADPTRAKVYAARWVAVKVAWGLAADQREVDALRAVLTGVGVAPPPAPSTTTTLRSVPVHPTSPRVSPGPSYAEPPPVHVPAPCHPSYSPCIPDEGTDVDCRGGSGNGPRYVSGPVKVHGPDEYDLDRDGDGVGCE